MENVNKQLLDALKSVTLSEEDIELERSVAPEEYDRARNVIAKADAMIVKELKDIEESCDHKKPELFAMIQEYGAAEHSQNDGLAIHLLSKIKEAIAAAEQAEPGTRDVMMRLAKLVKSEVVRCSCPDDSPRDWAIRADRIDLAEIVGALMQEVAAQPPAVPDEVLAFLNEISAYAPQSGSLCAPTALQGFAIRANAMLATAQK